MSTGAIIAIGVVVAAVLLVALLAVQRAGSGGPTRDGGELDPPDPSAHPGWGRRRGRRGSAPPQVRLLATIIAALAALGAGLASFLATGHHH